MDAQAGLLDPKNAVPPGKVGVAKDLCQRLAVDEDVAAPQEVLGRVVQVAVDDELFVDVPGQERVVAYKRLRREIGHPGGLKRRFPAGAGLAARLPGDGPRDDYPLALGGFVGDHALGPIAAASRADAFAVDALVDHNFLAGLKDLRREADRPQRFLARAGVRVGSLRILAGNVVGRAVERMVVPERKRRPVRQEHLLLGRQCRPRRRHGQCGANR